MGQETMRVARNLRGNEVAPSPFILWEGGRRDAGADGPAAGDRPLSVAVDGPSLLDWRSMASGRTANPTCDGTIAVLALPLEAPALDSRPRTDRDGAEERRAGWLDWKLIGASLLLLFSMALGAMAVRGAVLDAAYGSLSWEDHRVVAGESIGSILAGRDLPDVGLGRLADWVEERNGLDSATLVPGQVISVPV